MYQLMKLFSYCERSVLKAGIYFARNDR